MKRTAIRQTMQQAQTYANLLYCKGYNVIRVEQVGIEWIVVYTN